MTDQPEEANGADAHAVSVAALDEVAAATETASLDAIRARYLGRGDGLLTLFRKRIGTIADPEARRAMGQMVNALVERVTDAIEERRAALSAMAMA